MTVRKRFWAWVALQLAEHGAPSFEREITQGNTILSDILAAVQTGILTPNQKRRSMDPPEETTA